MRVMRGCEAVLPLGLLRALLVPLVIPSALRDLGLRRKLEKGWRHLHVQAPGQWIWFCGLVRFHLVRFLNFWPDRLASKSWRDRLDSQGLEAVKAVQTAGQPTVLVCLHHGPIHVLRYLLRAAGLPCAMVVLESRKERSSVRELKDRLSPPPEVPNVFCRDELKEMKRFMKQGGCLLVAADYGRGKMIEVDFGPTRIQVASGAFRLANSVGATVFPVAVSETGGWYFKVKAGAGVLADGDMDGLASEVLDALATKILATPELMHSQLADSLGN
jgi:lauroyl/myristoyl acyltransferase